MLLFVLLSNKNGVCCTFVLCFLSRNRPHTICVYRFFPRSKCVGLFVVAGGSFLPRLQSKPKKRSALR